MTCDPRFTYVQEMRELAVGQERVSPLGGSYRIVAIERSGYVICQCYRQTKRLWCDVLERWRLA